MENSARTWAIEGVNIEEASGVTKVMRARTKTMCHFWRGSQLMAREGSGRSGGGKAVVMLEELGTVVLLGPFVGVLQVVVGRKSVDEAVEEEGAEGFSKMSMGVRYFPRSRSSEELLMAVVVMFLLMAVRSMAIQNLYSGFSIGPIATWRLTDAGVSSSPQQSSLVFN